MKVNARAFYTLTSESGQTTQCLRPKRTSPRGPFSGSPSSNRPLNEDETHRVTVFNPLPTDLTDNRVFSVDGVNYRVRKGGIDVTPAGAVVSCARETNGPQQRSP